MTGTLEIIVSVVGVGAVLLLALVGAAWRLGTHLGNMESRLEGRLTALESRLEARLTALEGRLERVESRIGDLGAGVRSLNQQVASIVGLVPTAFMYLHRNKSITDEEYHDTVGQFTSRIAEGSELLIDHLARSMNPLTSEEVQRFRELVDKARRGEFFTQSEVGEYDILIRKVRGERPDDPRIWPLVALGAFLLGLYLGQRSEDA